MDLPCPKCGGQMRSYERNGVTIDQCAECRGVFLDRGELDRLIDAEAAYEGQPGPAGRPESYEYDDPRHPDRPDDRYGRRRRRGFLGDLFDID